MDAQVPDAEVRLVPHLQAALTCGWRSKAEVHRATREGLFVRGIRLSHRNSVVAEHERAAIARARLRGATDDELRALVNELHSQREAA